MSAPLNPAILELARILAREAARRYIEQTASTQPAAPSAEERRAE
jgi:hypothetical protein